MSTNLSMSYEEFFTNPPRGSAEQKKSVQTETQVPGSNSAAASMSRLEYRMPGVHPENTSSGSSSNVHSLVEDWLRPGNAEHGSAESATTPVEAARLAEEQWRQERTQLEIRLAEQHAAASRAITAAREEGRREGRQGAEQIFLEERKELQRQIVEALGEFGKQRERYFHSVEREVVRLSLAIAGRVLHRQAQIDPLFLAGAVRVALDKLADTTGVVLRVAPAQVLAWQEMFRLHGGVRMQPEILGDLSLTAGECVLETHLGTVELGVKAQLEEIEKGFFDLLHHHPAASAGSHRAGNGMGEQSIS